MAKIEVPPNEALYPVPVVLVSCRDKKTSRANIITIAWCGVVSSLPPMLGISVRPSRHSHKLISETGDFVINIPTRDMLEKVDFCGVHSGKDVDKFALSSLTQGKAKRVSSPLIMECPVNIECLLRKTVKLGAHDMFIGEVLAVHVDETVTDKGKINFKKARPIVYNQGEYWDLGEKIGFYGFSSR